MSKTFRITINGGVNSLLTFDELVEAHKVSCEDMFRAMEILDVPYFRVNQRIYIPLFSSAIIHRYLNKKKFRKK